MGTRNGKWDGKGKPPTREAAVEYARLRLSAEQVNALPRKGTLTAMGSAVRSAIETAASEREAVLSKSERFDKSGPLPEPKAKAKAKPGDAKAKAAPGDAPLVDTNKDGSVADEAAAAGLNPGDPYSDFPGGTEADRGAPLLPGGLGGLPGAAELQVEDNSPMAAYGRRHRSDLGAGKVKIGPRYYDSDLLEPLRWSAERRADLQRVMHGIGLYGDAKVKLGDWSGKDSELYEVLLTASNTAGTTWYETLAGWKRSPPQELLDEIKGEGVKRPPIQLTNPLDIQQTAQATSQSLTGEVDPGFSLSAVEPYQAIQASTQNAATDMGIAGTGGAVTQAPSVSAFIEDKLRRDNPIEVDGYQFLTQFQQFMSMLGAQ